MNAVIKISFFLVCVVMVAAGCSSDDGGGGMQTPEQMQTAKLVGRWEPGTVIQEIDGEITDERFADFSITFEADKTYHITNSGGEAFEAGENKAWNYVDGNLNRIERLDNGFEFDVTLSNNDTELQIQLTVDESGSPLGRISNTTGGYQFNLVKQ